MKLAVWATEAVSSAQGHIAADGPAPMTISACAWRHGRDRWMATWRQLVADACPQRRRLEAAMEALGRRRRTGWAARPRGVGDRDCGEQPACGA
jgi:hypothetical protein